MQVVLRLFRTAQLLDKKAQRVFTPYGLSAAQFNILNLLSGKKEGLRASDLARFLVVDPSNITGLLRRMTRSGLVADRENGRDRRQHVVALTSKGRALWDKAARDYESCLKRLSALLTEQERTLMDDVLLRLGTMAGEQPS